MQIKIFEIFILIQYIIKINIKIYQIYVTKLYILLFNNTIVIHNIYFSINHSKLKLHKKFI